MKQSTLKRKTNQDLKAMCDYIVERVGNTRRNLAQEERWLKEIMAECMWRKFRIKVGSVVFDKDNQCDAKVTEIDVSGSGPVIIGVLKTSGKYVEVGIEIKNWEKRRKK